MQIELTRSLLESVKFAASRLISDAEMLRQSHKSPDGQWDDPVLHLDHQECLAHAYRLQCFAKTLAGVMRRQKAESN